MMNRRRILIIGFVLIMILSGCSIRKELVQYLEYPGCDSPCWQQITPGKSTFEEINKNVREIAEVEESSIYIDDRKSKFDSCIRWSFIEKNRNGSVCVYQNTAAFIDLFGDFGLTVEKSISLYGKPDQLVYDWQSEGDIGSLHIFLFYFKKGLVISYKQYDLDTIQIKPEINIDTILFYDPNLYPEIVTGLYNLVGEEDLINHSMEWPGFVKIDIRKTN